MWQTYLIVNDFLLCESFQPRKLEDKQSQLKCSAVKDLCIVHSKLMPSYSLNRTVVLIGRRNLPVIKEFGNIDWFL